MSNTQPLSLSKFPLTQSLSLFLSHLQEPQPNNLHRLCRRLAPTAYIVDQEDPTIGDVYMSSSDSQICAYVPVARSPSRQALSVHASVWVLGMQVLPPPTLFLWISSECWSYVRISLFCLESVEAAIQQT